MPSQERDEQASTPSGKISPGEFDLRSGSATTRTVNHKPDIFRDIAPVPSRIDATKISTKCGKKVEAYPSPPQHLANPKLVNISENRCLSCSKKFKHSLSLSAHVISKHKPAAILVCPCSFKCSSSTEFSRHQREKRQQIFDSEELVCCADTDDPAKI